jgi:hypothetical protein
MAVNSFNALPKAKTICGGAIIIIIIIIIITP